MESQKLEVKTLLRRISRLIGMRALGALLARAAPPASMCNRRSTAFIVHPVLTGLFGRSLVTVFRLLFEHNRALSFGKPEPRVNAPDDDES